MLIIFKILNLNYINLRDINENFNSIINSVIINIYIK